MATRNIPNAPPEATLDAERVDVCLDATYEAIELLDLIGPIVRSEGTDHGFHHQFRGVEMRLRELTSVLLAGLGEMEVSTRELDDRLYPLRLRKAVQS